MSTDQHLEQEAIAIIGMSCRFPGASTVEQFWRNLRDGVESITFFDDADLDRAAVDPAELGDPKYVKARGLVEDLERFDARFFGFSPREAELTDPQQRIFLECAWEAFERAGYEPSTFPGPVGVFAGAGANGYLLHHLAPAGRLVGTASAFQTILHNKNDHLATRVSYKLDLKGPSVSVQTACSTSLVAVVMASQSLLSHQCDLALAGGVSLPLPQRTGYLYNERGIGSPDGHCRAFDAKAQGTVPGAGAGVVLLKRLSDALADGDTIHAVIRGGALNNDGAAKVGYTAPSVDGQAEVIAMAQTLAGVSSETISYVEAHGTGTPIGDPIEVQALTQAFRRDTARTGFCALGAVKTNLGHLDTAAGIAGLIKTTLALEHRQLPPTLHFETPNPEIDFAGSPFFVNARLREWESATPRRAGVSAFGLGGTNAHVVLEEAPRRAPSGPSRPFQLLRLSARSDAALEAMTTRLAEHLKDHPTLPLADVAYTLAVGRRTFDHRRFVVCRDTEDAATTLAVLHPERVLSRVQESTRRSLVFLFPGQGSQHPGMAADLHASEPVFREEVDRCLEVLRRRHDLDLKPLLFAVDRNDAHAAARLEQTAVTQPALFVVEYALARLLLHWGLQPGTMFGHSVGELVAACLAGVFSLEDALDLVALRGRLLQSCPPGAMLSVQLPERELLPWLSPEVEIAAVNGPSSCVVAGSTEAVSALERRLVEASVPCRRLRTSHAFHCALVESAVAPFRDAVARVPRNAPKLRFLSCVTGTWITPEQATSPDYWAQHLRQPVRFADGLDVLLQDPDAILLEVGPGRALRTLARWHPRKKPGQAVLPCLPAAEERTSDVEHLLRTMGQLWLQGVEAPGLYAGQQRHRQPLPTYPFERQRHWVEPRAHALVPGTKAGSLEKNADLAGWFYLPVWKESVPLLNSGGAPRIPWLFLVDEAGLGTRMAERLRQAGGDVIEARRGRSFRRTGANTFEVPPTREGYAALLSELHTESRAPERVIHLFGLTPEAAGASSEDVLARSFYSLLFLAQALGSQGLERPVRLVTVSNGMQEVAGDDLLWPEQATVLGPIRVIPREYPSLRCRSVDVSLPAAGSPHLDRLAELLAAEVSSETEEPVAAYRAGRRWVQGFDALRLETGTTPPLRERGTVLITGGFGGLGLAIAESFAEKARARLVLTTRTGLPPREEWTRLLEQQGNDEVRRRIRAVLRLEERGAEVLVCRADVTDLEAMRGVVATARERFGELHGVIHAAGVPGGGLIQLKAPEAAAAVLAPKVLGTQMLLSALEGSRPDFVVACSSLSSVVGRLGQVDYTASNAFLDAAMRAFHARTGIHAVAVNWGAWEEVGMAARKDATEARPVRLLEHPLLHRCLEDTQERMVFASDIGDARSRWVVDEHRILGTPTVPGVAWFELVRAALAGRADGRTIELVDTFFLFPLRVPDGETREARLVIEQEPDGYRWVVRSQPTDGAGKATAHATGRARFLAPQPPRTLDLDALRRRCEGTPDSLEAEYEEDLGPRWRSVRSLHLGKGELLVVLELQPEFASDLEHMRFHPSLMDRTSGMAKSFLAERGYYLPFGYGRLRFLAPLPRRIYAHARFLEHAGSDGETRAFDVTLADESGRVLAEVERLTQKRVNDPAAELRALADAAKTEAGSTPASSGSTHEEILPSEGIAALERLLGARVMPQVVVSVRDLQATQEHTDEVVRERIAEAAADLRTGETLQPRPNLKKGYVAPRTELEQKLAASWQEVLGIERIGVHDDFFELGGDSVQAIQIMARGSRLGLQLNPEQFFQTSTIAELARVLEGMLTRQAEQGPVVGPVPLTPEQRRILEGPPELTARASRVLAIDLPGTPETERVARVLDGLLVRHDALRHRFTLEATGWRQESAPPGGEVPLRELDLGTHLSAGHSEALRVAEEQARALLDPLHGPLLTAVLLRGAGEGSRLLLAGHELVIDGTSWRILAEDIREGMSLEGGGAAHPKTWSFQRWAEQLAGSEPSSTEDAAAHEGTSLTMPARTAKDSVHERTASLTAEETRVLQQKLSSAWRADLGEALLVGFARALGAWTEGRVLHLDFTRDGRARFEGLDCSRTVGCFDVRQPLRIELPEGSDEATILKVIKEEVRGLSAPARRPERNEVRLRMLGGSGELPEGLSGRGLPGGCLLELEGSLAGGRLHVRCTHEGTALPMPVPERLMTEVLGALRALSAGDREARDAISPTDFPLAGLDDSQMDVLSQLIDQVDQAND